MRNNKYRINFELDYCVTYYKEDNYFFKHSRDSINVEINNKDNKPTNINKSNIILINKKDMLKSIRLEMIKSNIYELLPDKLSDKDWSTLESICNYCDKFKDPFIYFFNLFPTNFSISNHFKLVNQSILITSPILTPINPCNFIIFNLLKDFVKDIFPNQYLKINIDSEYEFKYFLSNFNISFRQFRKYLLKYRMLSIKLNLGYNRRTPLGTKHLEIVVKDFKSQTIKTSRYSIVKANNSFGIDSKSKIKPLMTYNFLNLNNLEHNSVTSLSFLNKSDKFLVRRRSPTKRSILRLGALDDY